MSSLHPAIEKIINKENSFADKAKELEDIQNSLDIAKQILNGEFIYCKLCKDYFLNKSFFTETETVEERVCVFSDPINSGGDVYENKKVTYTYKVCPKGHKHSIDRKEHF